MIKNPKVHVPNSPIDHAIDALSALLLILSWSYLLLNYADIPETIPTHYNFEGVADKFGDKSQLFALVGVGTIIYVALYILNYFPHKMNLMATITEENATYQYSIAKKMIRLINLAIAITFSYLSSKSVHNALNGQVDLDTWMTPVILMLLFAPLAYYLFKLAKK
jgi:uncharacterized membrane protein